MNEILQQWGDVPRSAILALLDFCWQSSLLIAVVMGGMKLCRVRGASIRHFVLVCALFGMSVLPSANLFWPRVGISRLSVRKGAEEGSGIRPVVLPGRFDYMGQAGKKMMKRPSSSSDAAGRSGTVSAAEEDARASGGARVRRIWDGIGSYKYELLFALWVAGTLFGLFRAFWGYRMLGRMRATGTPVEDACLLAAYGEALKAADLRVKPRLLTSDRVHAPMAMGAVDPVVVVPDTLADMLSSEELRMVLLHELLHIKRYDLLVGMYQRLLHIVFFFHPLVRYLNRRIVWESEDQCDGMVVEHTGDPAAYATALMEVLQRANAHVEGPLFAGAGLHHRSRLRLRVRGILEGISVGSLPRWGIAVGVILTCTLAGLLSSVTMLSRPEAAVGPERVSLSGIVRDPTGAPVEGARVYAFRGGSTISWGEVTTGADGQFRIDGLSPGTFSVRAEVRGYTPQLLHGIPGDAQDVALVLSEGGSITGKVLAEGGVPVSEVGVTAEYHSGMLHSMFARTDEEGVYRILDLPEGVYQVRVQIAYNPSAHRGLVVDPRGADRIVRVQEGGTMEGVDFLLIPGRSVSGRVLYRETGLPAGGVPVTLMGQDRMDTMSDEQGRYVFRGVPPGRYTFWTDLAGYETVYHPYFEMTIEEDLTDVEVSLIRRGTLSVVVRDEEGGPIPGAEVRYRMLHMAGQRTDREGWCGYENVSTERPAPEVLWVDHPEYAFAFLSVDPIQEGEDREIEVTLTRGGTLKGRMTDWESKPVSDARIRVFGPVGYRYPETARTVYTNQRGEYRAGRLPPGTLKAMVDHMQPAFVPEAGTVEIREGKIARWDVSVRSGGTLMGRVVDREGRPVKGMEIAISPGGLYQWEILTDEDGFYRADHLPAREYRVSVRMLYHLWHQAREQAKKVLVVEGEVARADVVVEHDGSAGILR